MAKHKKYTFEELASEARIAEFLREFQTQTDRGTAVVAAAYLDDLLEVMLKAHFQGKGEDVVKGLFTESGSLGTFSSRIKLGYCLNLIRDDQFTDLETVRKIRNEFSHQHIPLSFETPPLCDWCDKLKQAALPPFDEASQRISEIMQQNRRMRFIGTCIHLAVGLMVRIGGDEKLPFEK